MITAMRSRRTMLKKTKRLCRLKPEVKAYFDKYPDNPLKRGITTRDIEYYTVETGEDTNLEITGVNPDGSKILTFRPAVTSNDLARHNPQQEIRDKKMLDMKKAVEKAAQNQPAPVDDVVPAVVKKPVAKRRRK